MNARHLESVLLVLGTLALALVTIALGRPSGHHESPAPPAVSAPIATVTDRSGSPTLAFTPSGIDGGGFQNVVAVSPVSSTVVLGADVSGLHRSSDGGERFMAANRGLPASAGKVAAVAYHPSIDGLLVAGTGFQGQQGGVLRSEDDGHSWEVVSEAARFSGNNNPRAGDLPRTHPRSTGSLLVFSADGRHLFAATFDQGVMRSDDLGSSWQSLGLAGRHLRGLALDPEDPDVLYAASYGQGLQRTTAARGAGGFHRVQGSPPRVEDVLVLEDTVVVAAGTDGVHVRDPDGQWRPAPLPRDEDTAFSALAGSVGPRGTQVFAAAHRPARAAGSRPALWRSTDLGHRWEPLTTPDRLDHRIGGDGEPWWLTRAQPSFAPSAGGYTPGQIVIDPKDDRRIFLAGRSGLWRSLDGGERWHPAVRGLGVTSSNAVAMDPDEPGTVYIANTDYRLLVSRDALRTVQAVKVGATAAADVTVVASARGPATVALATGARGRNAEGEVFVTTTPERRDSWRATGLAAATGGKRPLAVAGHEVDGSTILLAAVEGSGIWRHDGSWSQRSNRAMRQPQASRYGSMVWTADGRSVVLYDHATGVFVSTDAGRSWTLRWAQPSNHRAATRTGYVAADPTRPGDVVVSTGRHGVFRLDTRDPEAAPEDLGITERPGALTVDVDGHIWVAELPATGRPARLLVRTPDARVRDVADNVYRATATNPAGIAVGPDGTVVVALNNNGAIVAREEDRR